MKRLQNKCWMVGPALLVLVCLYLSFSAPIWLMLGGSVLAGLWGAAVIYFVFRDRELKKYPGCARVLFVAVGLGLLVGGAVGVFLFARGVTSAPGQSAADKIERAARDEARRLDLSGMGLTSLPLELWQLSDLVYLDLSNNRLSALPPEIGRLVKLRELDLSRNRLTALPAEIGRLAELKYLHATHNQLAELPPEIGRLGQLSALSLFDNRLTVLPAEIGQLSQLEFLSLNYNRLTSLPAEIARLDRLQALWLQGNPFDEMPPELAELPAGVEIEYDPDAKLPPRLSVHTVNFVCSGVIVLAFGLAWGLDRWLEARERALQEQSRCMGQVFPIPSFARGQCVLALLLAGAVSLLLFASGLNAGRTRVSLETGVGVPLVLSPLMLFCVYMLAHNSGTVVLTPEAVMLRRLWRDQSLAYGDIVRIESGGLGLPPTLVLKGRRATLKIPRSAIGFPGLHQALLQRATGLGADQSPRAEHGREDRA